MQIQWDVMAVADLASDVTLDAAHARRRDRDAGMARLFGGCTGDADAMARSGLLRACLRRHRGKCFPGRYTREGDVRALLAEPDDLFVVARTGDEVALAFADSPGRGPLRRTFLLRAEGYSKEMDLNSSSPDHVLPLPFRGLTTYPSVSPSADREGPATTMLDRYNTRWSRDQYLRTRVFGPRGLGAPRLVGVARTLAPGTHDVRGTRISQGGRRR